jgi:hypothetical protein
LTASRAASRAVARWIAASAALAGSGLTAFVTSRAAKRHADGQERTELVTALQACGYAVTNLGLEIQQLPPATGAATVALSAASARLPMFDWTVGQISRRTAGRPTMRAVDLYNTALNRLLLLAPESILRPVEAINQLVRRAATRDDQWADEWSAACAAFTSAARDEVRRR